MAGIAGFRMPAEWEPHDATWLAWPHERTDWPGKFAPLRWIYAEVTRHLSRVERVCIIVCDTTEKEKARLTLEKAGANLAAVDFHICPTNRGWLRDSGPIFIKDSRGHIAITNWIFNAWAKYDDWQADNAIPDFINRQLKMKQHNTSLVLEGGSIDVNGKGSLLTTEECLLSPVQPRNPGFSREQIENAFARYLGIHQVLWLAGGITGDDTHGHVDDVARFAGPSTVVAARETDVSDINYAPLQENLRLLRRMENRQGQPLRIVTLPMPEPVFFNGQRLPASYANFYIANRLVLVPTFNDPNDRVAMNTLARLFPNRKIVGIYSRDLVLGRGALHCIALQQPAHNKDMRR